MNDAPPLPSPSPRTGSLIAGKYRLEESLGAGAMGVVWRGVHVMLGHSVAVKVLRNAIATSPQGIARFEQEARLSARLGEASRHIARVHDYGMLDDGSPFVVMELLKGESLSARLARETVLPLSIIADVVHQLCRALATAHKAGVVHRDLKPANVFLCEGDPEQPLLVKLVDFGVAKMLEDQSFQPTHIGEIVGTPSYMSPEQLKGGGELDARSDLWAVAAMAYRMLTGRPPFGVGNLVELSYRIVQTEPSAPTERAPSLPPAIDAWMRKGLAKRAADRFQTAGELSETLRIALGEGPAERSGAISARLMRSSGTHRLDDIDALIASGRFEPPRKRARMLSIVGILALLAISGAVIVWRVVTPQPVATTVTTDSQAVSASAGIATITSSDPSPPGAASAREVQPMAPSTSPSPTADESSVPAQALPKAPSKPSHRPSDKPSAPASSATGTTLQDQAGQLWRKKDEL